jgi:ligand-binding SRPBCC domain-containing protein
VPKIKLETWIDAPVERCFDLARDVGIHCETAAFTRESAVLPGRTSGLLEIGDQVTFEGVHFGLRLRLTARIVEMDLSRRFVDEMVRGPFRRLRHVHEFAFDAGGTLMRDTIEWHAPLGPVGWLADLLFLKRHLAWFLREKQGRLKLLAEGRTAAV